jgi:hypothetical protein
MDIGQIRNVAAEHGEITATMSDRLKEIQEGGRTRR